MNIRRHYSALHVYQKDAKDPSKFVDLTHHFYIGPFPIPSFGSSVEVLLPWSQELPDQLSVTFTLMDQHKLHPFEYASLSVVGYLC